MRRGAWRMMLAGVLLALPGSAKDAPLPSVDLGVRELVTHGLSLISRRTDEDWWAVAAMGPRSMEFPHASRLQVFRSADSGRSWREDAEATGAVPYIPDFFVWYTPEVGLIAGGSSTDMLRTADGGRTWDHVKPADSFRIYDLERAGGLTWICGSSGSISRSDDFGATWTDLKGTPFNTTDRCMEMSFLDSEHGWAIGMQGSLWATQDGGTTWRRLETPAQPPGGPEASGCCNARLTDVVLLSPEVGWIHDTGGRFQTVDGGKTWHPRPFTHAETDAALRVTTLEGGKRVITVSTSDDGAPATNRIPYRGKKRMVVMGDDMAVRVSGNVLSLYVSGQRVRTSPLTTAGTGISAPLDGLTLNQPGTWVGWKEDQVVLSLDQGLSWFVGGRAPEKPLRNLAIAKGGRLFAQMQTEALFVSMDLGRTWKRGESWLDAYDFSAARGDSPEERESPLHCLLTAPEAMVKVRLNIQVGCMGEPFDGHLELNLSKSHVVLSGSSSDVDKRLKVRSRKLPRDEGLRILRALVTATTWPEPPADNFMIPYQTVIEWSCLPEVFWRRKLEFTATGGWPLTLWRRKVELHGGGNPALARAHLLGDVALSGLAISAGYTRAVGVHHVALLALEGAFAK